MNEYVQRPDLGGYAKGHKGPGRVLIIDRNADAAETLGTLLRAHGYDVRVECDGSNGLRAANFHRPRVAILDLGTDTMDTYEIAARLRGSQRVHELYLVSLSECVVPAAYPVGEARFDAYLIKPAGYEALIGMLERVFASAE